MKKDKKKWAEQDKEYEVNCKKWDNADLEWKLKKAFYNLYDEIEASELPEAYKKYVHQLSESLYFSFEFTKPDEGGCVPSDMFEDKAGI